MSQIAVYLLTLNLWAVLVWAAASAFSRSAPGIAAWPAYWTGAVTIILLPWIAGFLASDILLGLAGAGAGAAIDTLAETAPRAASWAMAEAFAWAGIPVTEAPAASDVARAALPVLVDPIGVPAVDAALATVAPATPQAQAAALPVSLAAPAAMFAPAAEIAVPWLRASAVALVAVYGTGVAWTGGLRIGAHVRLRLLARGAPLESAPGAAWPVYTTAAPVPPCALGFPGRRILVPAHMLECIGADELAMILRHESAHIDRRDPEATLALSLVDALFWPNPAVRALINRWRLAAEIRADQAVAAGQPQARRMAYARLLVSALRTVRGAPLAAPSAALRLDQKGSVKMRLAAILDSGAPRGAMASRLLAGAAGVALAAAGALGCAAIAQAAPSLASAPVTDPIPLAPLPAPAARPAPVPALEAQAPAQPDPVPAPESVQVAQAAPQPAPRPEAAPGPETAGPARVWMGEDVILAGMSDAEIDAVCEDGAAHNGVLRRGAETYVLGNTERLCNAAQVRAAMQPGDEDIRAAREAQRNGFYYNSSNGFFYAYGDLEAARSTLEAQRQRLRAEIERLQRQSDLTAEERDRLEALDLRRAAIDRELADWADGAGAWVEKREEQLARRAEAQARRQAQAEARAERQRDEAERQQERLEAQVERQQARLEAQVERQQALQQAQLERQQAQAERQRALQEAQAERQAAIAEAQAEMEQAREEWAREFGQDWADDWSSAWSESWGQSWDAADAAALQDTIRDSVAHAQDWSAFGAEQGRIWGQYGARVGAIESRYGGMMGRVGALQGRVGALQGRLGALQGRRDVSEQERAELRAQLHEAQADLEEARADLDEAMAERERDLAELERDLRRDLAELGVEAPAGIHPDYDYNHNHNYDYDPDAAAVSRILEGGRQ